MVTTATVGVASPGGLLVSTLTLSTAASQPGGSLTVSSSVAGGVAATPPIRTNLGLVSQTPATGTAPLSVLTLNSPNPFGGNTLTVVRPFGTLNGGTFSVDDTESVPASAAYTNLNIGNTANGTLNHSANTLTISSTTNVGNGAGNVTGNYNLSGTGVLTSPNLNVGVTSGGTFTQTNGQVTVSNLLDIGVGAGVTGAYKLGPSGTLNVFDLNVGDGGNASFTQTGGANTVTDVLAIGSGGVNPTTTYSISGGSLNTMALVIGDQSVGTFTQSGGTVTVAPIATAFQFGGKAGDAYFLNGGTLTTPVVVTNLTGTGTFYFAGGILQANASSGSVNPNFMTGLAGAVVQANGGAQIDTQAFNITIGQALLHDPALVAGLDGGLTKLGAGTLTLTGASTYNGGTVVSVGTLALGDGGILGTAGVADNATVAFVNTGALTVGNVISGTGAVTQTGIGTTKLTGVNTYAGATNFNGGFLNAAAAETPGVSGPFGRGGTLAFGGGSLQYGPVNTTDYSARFSTAAGQPYSVDTNGFNVTFATALGSAGGTLTKLGAGMLTVTANDTYSGVTTVTGGTLAVSNNPVTAPGRLANTSAIVLNNGGMLLLSGSTLVNDRINNTAGVTINGGGNFSSGGLSEGAAPVSAGGVGGAAGVGVLTLGTTSSALHAAIDFAATQTGGALVFNNLATTGKGGFVNILNWTGTQLIDNGLATNDRLLFTTDPGFTRADLANWQFSNDSGVNFLTGGLEIPYNGYFEIVPVPEPSTWVITLLFGVVGVATLRRRF